MSKQKLAILGIAIIALLSGLGIVACSSQTEIIPSATQGEKSETITPTVNTPTISTPTVTIRSSPTPTRTRFMTRTPKYSYTPRPPTITNTPYPTFDVNTAKTHVPFPTAQCPVEDPNFKVDLGELTLDMIAKDLDDIFLKALSDGASINQVADAIAEQFDGKTFVNIEDLTGDGIPEVDVSRIVSDVIIGCVNGKYQTITTLSSFAGNYSPSLQVVSDMNLDGIPEIIESNSLSSGWNTTVEILEWDGIKFNSMIEVFHGKNSNKTSRLARALYWYEEDWLGYGEDWGFAPIMNGNASIDVIDTDHNGTKELVLTDGGPAHWDTLYNYGPWRGKQVTFKWDGIHYLYSDLEIDPPEYRFQAVQDADRLFLMEKYDEALEMYQDVIFSDELDWWSVEKMDNLSLAFFSRINNEITPTPLPDDLLEKTNEYNQLAAYARYRIVVNHVAQGWLSDALTVNQTLQEKYPEGTIGHEYAEWASLFLDEYQNTQDLKAACTVVVENADRHSEMLSPLGDSEHGGQSHIYEPEDVCPFAVNYE